MKEIKFLYICCKFETSISVYIWAIADESGADDVDEIVKENISLTYIF
jgi:hypothetical protein